MDSRQKQADYRKRMNAKGMVQITEWIPEADRAYFRQIASDLREGRRPQEKVVSAPPPKPPPKPREAVSTAPPTAAKSPHSRPDYPHEVRRLAVELSDSGMAPAQIRQRIIEIVGRAPDSKNWGKVIRIWRERLNS